MLFDLNSAIVELCVIVSERKLAFDVSSHVCLMFLSLFSAFKVL